MQYDHYWTFFSAKKFMCITVKRGTGIGHIRYWANLYNVKRHATWTRTPVLHSITDLHDASTIFAITCNPVEKISVQRKHPPCGPELCTEHVGTFLAYCFGRTLRTPQRRRITRHCEHSSESSSTSFVRPPAAKIDKSENSECQRSTGSWLHYNWNQGPPRRRRAGSSGQR